MSTKRRPTGFTIIETMVFCTSLLLLLGCIAMVVEGGMRYLRLGTAFQDAQSQTFVGMGKMVEELGQATVVGRTPESPIKDSNHVIVLWPQPPSTNSPWTYDGNNLQYHQWLCYYLDASTGELIRATLPVAGAPLASRDAPVAPALKSFQPPKGGISRVISRGVSQFLVNDGPSGQQLSLLLTTAVSTGTKKETAVTTRSVVTLANP